MYSFEISTPDMTYLLYADCEKEKDDWIRCVGRSIVRASATYLNKEDEASHAGTALNWNLGQEEDEVDYDELYENENHPYFND